MPAHILVVDDNRTNLDLMVYLLHSFGHDVTGAADGLAAFEAAERETFDLILSDILMPGIDGYEFAKRCKAHPRLQETPLVAVTALAMVGDKERALASGFSGYISKPIDPQTFVLEIDAYLPEDRRSTFPAQAAQTPANAP